MQGKYSDLGEYDILVIRLIASHEGSELLGLLTGIGDKLDVWGESTVIHLDNEVLLRFRFFFGFFYFSSHGNVYLKVIDMVLFVGSALSFLFTC